MARPLNIACLQTPPRPDFGSALGEALALADVAVGVGAELITLPEYCGGLRTEGAMLVPPSAPEASIEAQLFARACGKTNLHSLEPEDLAALTMEASAMAAVPLAGTNYTVGVEDYHHL